MANQLVEVVRELLTHFENVGGESNEYLAAIGKLAELVPVENRELERPKWTLERQIQKAVAKAAQHATDTTEH
jgi:hypothetical protein